jgi:tetratricopeptide (TPR) repeat protein
MKRALLPALLLASSLALAMLAGCATPPAPPPALFLDAAFAPPSETVGAADLFTLSPAMQAYLRSPAFKTLLRTRGREHGLIEALYSKQDLQLDYDAGTTRPAAATYAARAGNCLSLVIMTAAFARELGLTVRYQAVDVAEVWRREGTLYLVAAHVNIALGHRKPHDLLYDDRAGQELVIDFLPPPDAARLRTRPLDEAELVALFLNNRAAETLVQGRIDDAYWWARAALHANPAGATGYNTLGVIYQRHGLLPLAERAYRAALEHDPGNLVAMQNLGPLLVRLGRPAEAQALARRTAGMPASPL